MYQRVAIASALALFLTACSRTAPAELRTQFTAEGTSSVDVIAVVQAEHAGDGPRYLRAATTSLQVLTPWLGPWPGTSLRIVDPPWHGAPAASGADIVLPRTPWWSPPPSMTPELAVARAIARRYWSELIDSRALPEWFTDAVVEYLARRIVTPLFESANLPPGYAMLESRYFGGFVPRFARLRLMAEKDGSPLEAYRANPRVRPKSRASADETRALSAKTVLTLNTLERWVGRPAFDGALAVFARTARDSAPTLDDFARVVSSAAGYELSWFFTQTLEGGAVFDYGVADVTSVPSASGAFETTVVAARLGDGLFTGTSAPPVGPFESGRGLKVAVDFEDGERVIDWWDGRDTQKTLVYRSRSRAVRATIDPDRTLVLDLHVTNNGRTVVPEGGRAATRWAARWLIWFEHALLTCSALV